MHKEGLHGHKIPSHLTVLNTHSTPAACFQGHYTGYLDVMTVKAQISESFRKLWHISLSLGSMHSFMMILQ